ncbi:Retrovirus-related Pol polyprotein from transposon TNT 1-94-like protein [Drosera capensis]
MAKNKVLDLVDLLSGCKAVGKRLVLKAKRKVDRSIDKYKVRLVEKGYTQTKGIDYGDTFSLVVRFVSLRLIFSIGPQQDYELYQMDVKTTLLNEKFIEEIYLTQLVGFEVKGQECKVYRLNHSIYGLKQSLRECNLRFHQFITSIGFDMIKEDRCVYLAKDSCYIKRSNDNVLILALYVDDILLADNDMDLIIMTQRWLSLTFEMKDMGEASYMLGVKVVRDRSKKLLGLSQEFHVKKIIQRFCMNNSKPVDTPMKKGCILNLDQCSKSDEEKKHMSKVPSAVAIGSLMYAMLCI